MKIEVKNNLKFSKIRKMKGNFQGFPFLKKICTTLNDFWSNSIFFYSNDWSKGNVSCGVYECAFLVEFGLYPSHFWNILASPNWEEVSFVISTKMGPNRQFWSVWSMMQLVHTKPSLISHWTNFCGENVANKDPVALLLYQSLYV